MKITLSLKPERVQFIKDEFPSASIGSEDEGFVKVSFEIVTNYDALKLFHAGIHCAEGCRVTYQQQ